MPHIIFTGTPDFTVVPSKFETFRADSNDWIIKVQQCYISNTKQTLIFDCTAVRSGFSQDFYLRAEIKDKRLTVRVDPFMRIERNEGVQRAIVAVAKLLKQYFPELSLSKSNLVDPVLPDGTFE